jgi:hypothetical protein
MTWHRMCCIIQSLMLTFAVSHPPNFLLSRLRTPSAETVPTPTITQIHSPSTRAGKAERRKHYDWPARNNGRCNDSWLVWRRRRHGAHAVAPLWTQWLTGVNRLKFKTGASSATGQIHNEAIPPTSYVFLSNPKTMRKPAFAPRKEFYWMSSLSQAQCPHDKNFHSLRGNYQHLGEALFN